MPAAVATRGDADVLEIGVRRPPAVQENAPVASLVVDVKFVYGPRCQDHVRDDPCGGCRPCDPQGVDAENTRGDEPGSRQRPSHLVHGRSPAWWAARNLAALGCSA